MSISADIILSAHDLQFRYKRRERLFKTFEHNALRSVSFSLKRGETLGVLGRNGCGKSTLLRILAGIINPTAGKLECSPVLSRALLTLGLGFQAELSGRENALLSAMLQGASKKQAKELLHSIEEFAELGAFFEQPVSTYSSGMRARLGFATAIKTEVDILLLDEVLSVGDAHFRHKAESAMLNKIKGAHTVVFVSHNPEQINRICNRAIWLEAGEIRAEGETQHVAHAYHTFMQKLDEQNA